MTEEDIELRSEEVQELLGHVPHWTIRSGITVIFFIILGCLTLSWFIKYPEIIAGNSVITTKTPPIRMYNKAGGELVYIYDANSEVEKGTVLAQIKNPLTNKGKLFLEELVTQYNQLLSSDSLAYININEFNHTEELGTIASTYNSLIQNTTDFQTLLFDPYEEEKIAAYQQQINNYIIVNNTFSELNIQKQLAIEKKSLNRLKIP